MESPKQVLSIKVSSTLYQRLKREIGNGKVSRFIENLVSRELDEQARKLAKEQKEFKQRLVRGYQAMNKNKRLKEELTVWEETLEDGWNK